MSLPLSTEDEEKVGLLVPQYTFNRVQFRDITPLLGDFRALKLVCDALTNHFRSARIDAVAGLEARGFIFGPIIALALGVGFVPLRKPGKLPGDTLQQSYQKEYGLDVIEVQRGAIKPGQRILIVDDLLATGGTLIAACQLAKAADATPVGCALVIELPGLNGRRRITEETGVTDIAAVLSM